MSAEAITTDREVEEEEGEGPSESIKIFKDAGFCRREKRKLAKKLKRKHIRKEIALKVREEEEARSNDDEEQRRLLLKEKEEAEMIERQRKEFEEQEKLWMERAAKKAQEEEEESQRKLLQEESCRHQAERENELKEDDDEWEYEEGTAEVIFQGNEIIVKKKRVKVAKRRADNQQACIETLKQDASRPTSNPLPPKSEAYGSYKINILMFDSVQGRTCLHYAAYYGHSDCLQAILDAAHSSPVADSWGFVRFVNVRDGNGAKKFGMSAPTGV
ncbi:Zinc finger ccch domain-containing protein [Thalictrum thalictroides]|uniref:Zinc finger ccch domain-containing protein n=1 Tax=Thalictrum thalictroides TaxID=46969 RepID=A0A7J6VS84_THATH|nr:Zinc finger ccch domain-containing protein [Thalictrum thalictroides]